MKSTQISGCFVCILIILIILYYNFRPKKVMTEGHCRGGYSGMRRSRSFGRGWAGNSGYYIGGGCSYAVNPLYMNLYFEDYDYPFYYYPYYLYKRLYYV